jgi:hypothetical protein
MNFRQLPCVDSFTNKEEKIMFKKRGGYGIEHTGNGKSDEKILSFKYLAK